MADGDFVLGDKYLLHEEPDDTLPFGDVQGFGGRMLATVTERAYSLTFFGRLRFFS